MLPTPVTFKRRPYRKPSISGHPDDIWRRRFRLLFARARVTNLALLLLLVSLLLSLLWNFHHLMAYEHELRSTASLGHHFEETCKAGVYGSTSSGCTTADNVRSIEDTIVRSKELRALQHLIIVPGHGVWQGYGADTVFNESTWALELYQQGSGARTRIDAFVSHIRKGVELADADRSSLLIFSGGATRSSTTTTEATSYLSIAVSLSLLSPTTNSPYRALDTFARSATEEYALDSYQNLLFSIARFREVTGHYPSRITVVGYSMKRRRFEELHRAALRWPLLDSRWNYVGIDIEDENERQVAVQGEVKNGFVPYLRDLYGCHNMLLSKRRNRNVHHRTHPYHISAPELSSLLEWCPEPDEGMPLQIDNAHAKFDPESVTEHELDNFLADALTAEINAIEDSYTSVFNGSLPWDVVS